MNNLHNILQKKLTAAQSAIALFFLLTFVFLLAIEFNASQREIGNTDAAQISSVPEAKLSSADTTNCPAGKARSISQFDITWFFDTCYTYGQFVNGEYWVIGPVVVTNISPKTDKNSSTHQNGSMVNPVPGLNQGFDYYTGASFRGGVKQRSPFEYNSDLNASLRLPLSLKNNDVLVSATTNSNFGVSGPDQYVRLYTIAALTVLPSVPAEGSFRPSVYGTDRTVKWNKSNIDYSIFKNLDSVSEAPTKETIEASLPALPWFEWTGDWQGGEFMPKHNTQARNPYSSYGREISQKWGQIGLWLNLSNSTLNKEAAIIKTIQAGIDIYGFVTNTPSNAMSPYYHDGGHKSGRKLPVLIAAAALNDPTLKTFVNRTDVFQEDTQTWIVTQSDVGRSVLGEKVSYEQKHVGVGEWGVRHRWEPNHDDSRWSEAGYRTVVWPAMIAPVLTAKIMNLESLWNHPAIFKYNERYISISGSGWGFANNMWNAYGNLVPIIESEYILTTTSSNGSITRSPNKTSYTNGEVVTLTATPASGYQFAEWTGCTSSTNTCVVTMNANKTVSVSFTSSATLTWTQTSDSSIMEVSYTGSSLSKDWTGLFQSGAANTSYINTAWSYVNTVPNGKVNITIPNNITPGTYEFRLLANDGYTLMVKSSSFEIGNQSQTFTLSTISTNGSITRSPNKTSYTNGEVVTLTATPASGYQFAEWTGCTSSTNTCVVVMDGNKTVTAAFVVIPNTDSSFKVGARVEVNGTSINVRSSGAILSNNLLGTQSKESLGTIVDGPLYSNDARGVQVIWWNIDYDSGVDGWSGQDNLILSNTQTDPNLLYSSTKTYEFGGAQSIEIQVDDSQITNALTVSAKIIRNNDITTYPEIVADEDYYGKKGYYLGDLDRGLDNPICFRVNGSTGHRNRVCEPSSILNSSSFTHYVGVFDGRNKRISLYRDGVLVSSTRHSSSSVSINTDIEEIGREFKGQIKDVQIFNAVLNGNLGR